MGAAMVASMSAATLEAMLDGVVNLVQPAEPAARLDSYLRGVCVEATNSYRFLASLVDTTG